MIAIVDYGMGNVGSVRNALKFLGAEGVVTDRAEDFEKATHIIFPGVGAFQDGMKSVRERNLIPILTREVLEKKKPLLGVCLGMQLFAARGEEGGEFEGLGWVKGVTKRLAVDEKKERLPHIGWNDVTFSGSCPLFANISSPTFYFVHSYVLAPEEKSTIVGTCEYGESFAAVIQKDNLFGVQFHPEKSQKSGLALLRNFISL